MSPTSEPRRFRRLPVARVGAFGTVPVATTLRSRLLGLALLHRTQAKGLLLPRCRAVHTIGMRFSLDLHFLDADGRLVAVRRAVAPGRMVRESDARAVLELPSPLGGVCE